MAYSLGLRYPPGKKADLGNCVHKVMETLANIKLCKQKGLCQWDDDNLGEFDILNFSIDDIIRKSYEFYVKITPYHDWEEADFRKCEKWTYDTLEHSDGLYSPLNRTIIDVERRFEITLEQPWAKYEYKLQNGEKISGQLKLLGTIDLVVDDGNGGIEILDWKTGSRNKFPSSKPKEYVDLIEDPQFLMYTYAARRVYNQPNIMLTVFFCRDGGPFTLPFSSDDDEKTEWMLRREFNTIRNTKIPKLCPGWYCKVCPFATNYTDEGETLCEYYERRVRKDGIDKLFVELGSIKKINNYGDGGGKRTIDKN